MSNINADLIAANGAILFWQLPKADVEAALSSGARMDGDLLVHKDAFRVCDGGYTMSREEGVVALAEAFAEVIRQWLTEEEMAEVKRRNAKYGPGICATHDFCDANMAMLAAFPQIVGREPDGDCEGDMSLWNEAWSFARKAVLS